MEKRWKAWCNDGKLIEESDNGPQIYHLNAMPEGLPEWNDTKNDSVVGFLDTETTGIVHGEDEIIELAIVITHVETKSGKIARAEPARTWFRKPDTEISGYVSTITGIDSNTVKNPTWNKAEIGETLRKCDWLIAHNAGFDRPFVEEAMGQEYNAKWGCSLEDIDWMKRRTAGRSLGALCASAGLWFAAHRAHTDARACAALTQTQDRENPERRLLGTLLANASRTSTLIGIETRFWPGNSVNAAFRRNGLRHDPEKRTWWTDARSAERAREIVECAATHWPQAQIVRAAGNPRTRYRKPQWTSRESVANAKRRMETKGCNGTDH